MADTVIIRKTAAGWEWLDPDNGAAGVQAGLPQLCGGDNASPLTPCILLLPAEQVFLGSVHIATRKPRQLVQAVPFAVEEQLAEDPELLHFAAHHTGTDDLVEVMAVSRTLLRKSLDELQVNGLVAMRVVPDALALPWSEGTISLLLDRDRALVRYGKCAASAIEADLLDPWLSLLIDELEVRPEKITLFSSGDTGTARDWPLACSTGEMEGGALSLLAQGLSGVEIDLLQGEFSAHLQPRGFARWKGPASAAVAAVVLAFVVNYVELQNMKSGSSRLEQAIESRFRQSFPGVQRLLDPLIQAERELQQLRGGSTSAQSDFLYLVGGIAASISAQPDLKLTSLRYRERRMQLELEAANIDQLEQLQKAAESAGLVARLESARLGRDGVSGTLTLTSMPS